MEDIYDNQLYENAPPPVMTDVVDCKNFFKRNFKRKGNMTKVGISHKELKEIKNEYLIELIEFINTACSITIQNRYIDCTYSIFKIIKKKKNIFEIIINKKEAKKTNYKIKENIMHDDQKENNDNENNVNAIKIEKENKNIIEDNELSGNNTFFCEKHNQLFINLEKYFLHCKENGEKLICENCLKGFWKIEKYKDHKCSIVGESKKNHEEDDEEEDIKCSECDLIFDSVESMSLHYFEKHEKKKQEIIKKRKEKRKIIEEKKKKENTKRKEIDDRLAKRLEKIIELDKEKKNKKEENIKKNIVEKNEKEKEVEKDKNENKINIEKKLENEKEKNDKDIKREEDVKKQEDIIKEALFQRKNEKIAQKKMDKEEDEKRKNEIRKNIRLKGQIFNNKGEKVEMIEVEVKKQLTKEELEELEEIRKEKETEVREEREELEKLRQLDELDEEERQKRIKELNKPYEDFLMRKKLALKYKDYNPIKGKNHYECYHDNQIFKKEKSYIKHYQTEHPDDFPFYCRVCNKGFMASQSLESHIKNSKRHKKNSLII